MWTDSLYQGYEAEEAQLVSGVAFPIRALDVAKCIRAKLLNLPTKTLFENKLLPSTEFFYGERQAWKFQQDGATAHNWFKEQQIEILP